MARYIELDALVAEIERLKKEEGWCQVGKDTADVYYARGFRFACERIKDALDSLEVKEVQEESVSEELEKAAIKAFKEIVDTNKNNFLEIFKAGAQWQKEQEIKYKHRTFLQGEKSVANYILKMIDNGWHINAIYTVCKDKLKED